MRLVEVFKTSRKPGAYLYLERGKGFDGLPEGLRELFEGAELALSLTLTPERSLARYSGAQVLGALDTQGYFLQLPPVDEVADVAGPDYAGLAARGLSAQEAGRGDESC